MAIFPDVAGLQAEIVVDGEPLPEYDDDDDNDADSGTITKYVEALSDKEFALKYTFNMETPIGYGVEAKIDVDGKKCHVGSPLGPKPHYRYGPGYLNDGKYFRQHYRFTALEIVEEVDGTANPRDIREGLESKGRISLEFRFISNLRKSPREPSKEPTQHLRAIGAVPEKALKGDARSHQATLSEPQPSRRGTRWRYDYVDEVPFAKIIFKYRSRAALKALRIISGDQDEDMQRLDDVPEDEMTPEQLREALRRSRRREDELQRVKRESVARNVKRERAQTIDLVNDDDEVTIVESRTRKRPRGEPEVIVLD